MASHYNTIALVRSVIKHGYNHVKLNPDIYCKKEGPRAPWKTRKCSNQTACSAQNDCLVTVRWPLLTEVIISAITL